MRALWSKMKNRLFWPKSGAAFHFWTFIKCPFSKSANPPCPKMLIERFSIFYNINIEYKNLW